MSPKSSERISRAVGRARNVSGSAWSISAYDLLSRVCRLSADAATALDLATAATVDSGRHVTVTRICRDAGVTESG